MEFTFFFFPSVPCALVLPPGMTPGRATRWGASKLDPGRIPHTCAAPQTAEPSPPSQPLFDPPQNQISSRRGSGGSGADPLWSSEAGAAPPAPQVGAGGGSGGVPGGPGGGRAGSTSSPSPRRAAALGAEELPQGSAGESGAEPSPGHPSPSPLASARARPST